MWAVALKVGAAVSAVFVLLAAAAAVLDFSAFFTAFHGLFFEAGTWTFPYDSLLIRLFPESFWVAAGVGWAAARAHDRGGVLDSGVAACSGVVAHAGSDKRDSQCQTFG